MVFFCTANANIDIFKISLLFYFLLKRIKLGAEIENLVLVSGQENKTEKNTEISLKKINKEIDIVVLYPLKNRNLCIILLFVVCVSKFVIST